VIAPDLPAKIGTAMQARTDDYSAAAYTANLRGVSYRSILSIEKT
jgi:hypothetical protein